MSCGSRRVFFPCAYFLVASSLVAAPPETRPVEGLREHTPAVHALTNVRIVVAPGHIIDKGTIVVREGAIVAVGPTVVPSSDARVWDLAGKSVYAGLIDAYSEMPATLPSGGAAYWNQLVTPELNFADQYKPDTAANEKLRGQGFVCRLVAPSNGIVKGTSVLVATSDEAGQRAILRSNVALHLRLGVPRNRSRGGYPNSPMGAVALARQAMLDADWYSRAWAAYDANGSLPRPERNDALAALHRFIDGRQMVVIDGPNELYSLRADAFAREFSLNALIRGSGQEYQRLEAIRATGRAIIVPVNFPRPPAVNSPEAIREAEIDELLHWDLAPENPGRLDAAGVKIAFSGDGLRDLGEYLAQVRVAVARGMASDAALRGLTVAPAEMFGVADRLGTITVGKSASFVVTDGDLFDKKTKIDSTWIDGRRFEIEKAKPADVRGNWEIKLITGDKSETLQAKISGAVDKLEGKIVLPQPENKNKEIKLDKLAVRDRTVTGALSGKELNRNGLVQFSAVVLSPPEGAWSLAGTVAWPDGSHSVLNATRTAAHTDPEKSDKAQEPKKTNLDSSKADESKAQNERQKSEEKKKSPTKKKKAKKKKASKAKTPEAEKEKPDEKAKADEPKPTDSDTSSSDRSQKDSENARSNVAPEKASFAVNYPLGAFGRSASSEQPKHVVFKNATVWTCGPKGTLQNASVLVTEGKIAAIGMDLVPPSDAVVVDAMGKHIAPGIIDCHSHMATDGGVNEGTQAVTAEVRIGDFIDCNDVDIYRQLAGGVTTANVLHGSANPIGGQNQVIKLRWGTLFDEMKFAEAPPGIKFALGENVKRSNFVDESSTRYPQSRMGVEQIIRDAFQAAQAYRRQWQRWEKHHDILPPRRDLELETLLEIIDGKRWVHCHSYRQDEILALLRTCEDFGIRIATLQHILEGYKVADAMARHGAMGSSFSDWWAYKIEVYDAIPYNGALMHNAGVVVSFNSDDQELARHLNHEAAKAVKYGQIAPEEALKFVTLNAAKQLRIDQYVGSLEPGKHADFVVWSGPPLSLTSRCEQTWIDGRKYFDVAEDNQQRENAKKIRATLVQKILSSGQPTKTADENKKPDEELWPREDIYCRAREQR